jgi:hypothetical protein
VLVVPSENWTQTAARDLSNQARMAEQAEQAEQDDVDGFGCRKRHPRSSAPGVGYSSALGMILGRVLRLLHLIVTRLVSRLRLTRHDESWKSAVILRLRHQRTVPQRQVPASQDQLGGPGTDRPPAERHPTATASPAADIRHAAAGAALAP